MILKISILKKSRKCWFFQVKFILNFTWKNQHFRLFFKIEIFKIIFLQEKIIFFESDFFLVEDVYQNSINPGFYDISMKRANAAGGNVPDPPDFELQPGLYNRVFI